MSSEHRSRPNDEHVEPLYAAMSAQKPAPLAREGPSTLVRLVIVLLVAGGVLLLVIEQTF